MEKHSSFDIIGPIMIGPSSSHTAGATRLGKIAGIIAGGNIVKVDFYLHGSFAKTYRGHGTDKALVAGILGMDPWDERLRDSLEIANAKGIEVNFIQGDLGEVHPNTVKIVMQNSHDDVTKVTGSSIGGGNIVITEIDGEVLEFTGDYTTLIITHIDAPGVVSQITKVLYENNINIAFMKVYRSGRGAKASMIFEIDSRIEDSILDKIKELDNIEKVRVINSIMEGE